MVLELPELRFWGEGSTGWHGRYGMCCGSRGAGCWLLQLSALGLRPQPWRCAATAPTPVQFNLLPLETHPSHSSKTAECRQHHGDSVASLGAAA